MRLLLAGLLASTALLVPSSQAAAPHPASLLFAPNFSSNVMTVFDLRTNKVVKHLDVQAKGPCCVFVTPDRKTVMLVEGFSPYVTTVDVATLSVRRQTTIGSTIGDIGSDIQRDGKTFYANVLPQGDTYAINIATGRVGREFPGVGHFFVSRDGKTLFSANPVGANPDELVAWSTSTGEKLGSITTHGGSTLMMLRDDRHLYVQGNDIDVLDVRDPRHMRLTRTIPVGSSGWVGQLTPDGRQYWIPGEDNGLITVVDTVTSRVVKQIDIGVYGGGIDFSRNGRAYVSVSDQPLGTYAGTAGAFSYAGVAPGAALGLPSTTYRPGVDPPGEIYVYDTKTYKRVKTPRMVMPSVSFVMEVVDR
jgi:hypothetical protein